ncbi:MAG: hypothetical protein H6707_20215 [Deltaproteobacteria bacterium]|nr:hypothetical protein [Deltaproteobacteria bacterium]
MRWLVILLAQQAASGPGIDAAKLTLARKDGALNSRCSVNRKLCAILVLGIGFLLVPLVWSPGRLLRGRRCLYLPTSNRRELNVIAKSLVGGAT